MDNGNELEVEYATFHWISLGIATALKSIPPTKWNRDCIEVVLRSFAALLDLKVGDVMMTARIALIGCTVSESSPELVEIIGQEESIYCLTHSKGMCKIIQ